MPRQCRQTPQARAEGLRGRGSARPIPLRPIPGLPSYQENCRRGDPSVGTQAANREGPTCGFPGVRPFSDFSLPRRILPMPLWLELHHPRDLFPRHHLPGNLRPSSEGGSFRAPGPIVQEEENSTPRPREAPWQRSESDEDGGMVHPSTFARTRSDPVEQVLAGGGVSDPGRPVGDPADVLAEPGQLGERGRAGFGGPFSASFKLGGRVLRGQTASGTAARGCAAGLVSVPGSEHPVDQGGQRVRSARPGPQT